MCVIDIFSKYLWLIPLKKKSESINKAFKKNLQDSGRKRNIIWVDKGCEFYNESMKSWLKDEIFLAKMMENQ